MPWSHGRELLQNTLKLSDKVLGRYRNTLITELGALSTQKWWLTDDSHAPSVALQGRSMPVVLEVSKTWNHNRSIGDYWARSSNRHIALASCAHFGGTYIKIGTIQRRLAWPLRKDDTQIREAFQIFLAPISHIGFISSSCTSCKCWYQKKFELKRLLRGP